MRDGHWEEKWVGVLGQGKSGVCMLLCGLMRCFTMGTVHGRDLFIGLGWVIGFVPQSLSTFGTLLSVFSTLTIIAESQTVVES